VYGKNESANQTGFRPIRGLCITHYTRWRFVQLSTSCRTVCFADQRILLLNTQIGIHVHTPIECLVRVYNLTISVSIHLIDCAIQKVRRESVIWIDNGKGWLTKNQGIRGQLRQFKLRLVRHKFGMDLLSLIEIVHSGVLIEYPNLWDSNIKAERFCGTVCINSKQGSTTGEVIGCDHLESVC
jgi:hypothetical protein